jgi:hypothetical protein
MTNRNDDLGARARRAAMRARQGAAEFQAAKAEMRLHLIEARQHFPSDRKGDAEFKSWLGGIREWKCSEELTNLFKECVSLGVLKHDH